MCKFQTEKRKEVMIHTKEHHGEKQCPVCDKRIEKKSSLRNHIEEHHQPVPHPIIPSLQFREMESLSKEHEE